MIVCCRGCQPTLQRKGAVARPQHFGRLFLHPPSHLPLSPMRDCAGTRLHLERLVLVGFGISPPDAASPQPLLWPQGITAGSGQALNMTDVRVIIDSQNLFNKYLTFFTSQNVLLWTVSRTACVAAWRQQLCLKPGSVFGSTVPAVIIRRAYPHAQHPQQLFDSRCWGPQHHCAVQSCGSRWCRVPA